MISFLSNPKTVRCLLAVLAMLLLIGLFKHLYNLGYEAGQNQRQAEWDAQRLALVEKNDQLRNEKQTLQNEYNLYTSALAREKQKERDALQKSYDDRLAAVYAGTVRVYAPAKVPTCGASPSGSDRPARPSPTLEKTQCELEPAFVAALADIARDGDLAIVNLNEMIERYEAAQRAQRELAK